MKRNPIFEKEVLDNQLTFYSLSKIDGLELKKDILRDWFQRYESGKLNIQNETSIGADFLNDIFGDILGYNYRNPNHWNLEKELKTLVDGQKPDGTIGYFYIGEEARNVIYGVIELKDANTNLDKAQTRQNDKRTPVEQAFSYAPKYGNKCKWVIVSNFIEIRLYHANDASKYEVFSLEKLQDESELKKFLFLLQRDSLLNRDGTSKIERLIEKNNQTKFEQLNDKSIHVLDKIYNLLKKFEGLSYINPNILANAKPFNNSKEHVWHYSRFSLQSIEPEIFNFFKNVNINSHKIELSKQLEKELKEKGCIEYQEKVEFVIKRLNNCFILSIECYGDLEKVKEYLNRSYVIGGSLRTELSNHAGQLRNFSIDFREHDKICDCIRCSYSKLNFERVLNILKTWEGTKEHNSLASGYFHHIFGTNNFKTSFLIYQNIANQEKDGNEFIYFLAKYNLLRLHNLIEGDYDLEDKDKIMDQIRSTDLDLILHKLDIIDLDKRKALIEIKEETLQTRAAKEVEELIIQLEEAKASFNRGSRGQFPNYTFQLNQQLASFVPHYSSNFILGNTFTEYKNLCKKMLRGYLISYSIHEEYYARLKNFESFHIDLIIFDLFPKEVEKIFKEYKISKIILSEESKQDLIEKTSNFLQSNHGRKIWFTPLENNHLVQALTSYHFRQIYRHIFTNLFFLLARTKLEDSDCKRFIPTLVNFLKVDKTLYHGNLKSLSRFFYIHGKYISPNQFVEILTLTNEKEGLDNNDFVNSICYSINKNHSWFKLSDQVLVQKTILRVRDHFEYLVPLWLISDEYNRKMLLQYFDENLGSKFEPYFYRSLLFNNVIDINYKDYFERYIKCVDKSKGDGVYKLWKGTPELVNFDFINFISMMYVLNIDTNDKRISLFSNLCDWHEWLLNLENFDYSKFKSEWILMFHYKAFFKRFGRIKKIREEVKKTLDKKYHPRLAKIFVQYLC